MKPVGVLGASGYVGQGAVSVIQNSEEMVHLAGRSKESLIKQFGSKGKFSFDTVNLFDSTSVWELIKDGKDIINCTGPTGEMQSLLAQHSLQHDMLVVDVSGGKNYANSLKKAAYKGVAAESKYIYSAGAFPGLAEVYPLAVIQREFDYCEHLEVYFSGKCTFSITGARDILESLIDNDDNALSYIKQGRIEKIKTEVFRKVCLPRPIGEVVCLPLINEVFKDMVCRNNIEEAYFYNTFQSEKQLFEIINLKQEIIACGGHITESMVQRMLSLYPTVADDDAATIIFVKANGIQKGKKVKLQAALFMPADWNTASGWCAATAMHWLRKNADNKLFNENPVQMLIEAIPPIEFVKLFLNITRAKEKRQIMKEGY